MLVQCLQRVRRRDLGFAGIASTNARNAQLLFSRLFHSVLRLRLCPMRNLEAGGAESRIGFAYRGAVGGRENDLCKEDLQSWSLWLALITRNSFK